MRDISIKLDQLRLCVEVNADKKIDDWEDYLAEYDNSNYDLSEAEQPEKRNYHLLTFEFGEVEDYFGFAGLSQTIREFLNNHLVDKQVVE